MSNPNPNIRGRDPNPNPNNLFISDLEDLVDPARGLWIPALRPAPPARWVVILPKNAINFLLLFSVQELHQKQYFRQLKLLRFSSLFGKQRRIITHAAPRCGCSSHVWPAAGDGATRNNTMITDNTIMIGILNYPMFYRFSVSM